MRKLQKRVAALERSLVSDPVILRFADGSTREIRGPGYFLLDLFCRATAGDPTPEQAEQLDLIRECVSAQEPGGGHMVELIRIFLHGPVEQEDDLSRPVS